VAPLALKPQSLLLLQLLPMKPALWPLSCGKVATSSIVVNV